MFGRANHLWSKHHAPDLHGSACHSSCPGRWANQLFGLNVSASLATCFCSSVARALHHSPHSSLPFRVKGPSFSHPPLPLLFPSPPAPHAVHRVARVTMLTLILFFLCILLLLEQVQPLHFLCTRHLLWCPFFLDGAGASCLCRKKITTKCEMFLRKANDWLSATCARTLDQRFDKKMLSSKIESIS